jgi:hypothetical protein
MMSLFPWTSFHHQSIFRGSTLLGNMHYYIWCPYYLPSFMKFCSIVSEGLRWQAASVVNLGKFLSSVRTPYVVVQITRKFWSPEFCGSYASLNLKFPEIYFWSSLSAQLLWNYWTEFHETWTKFRGSIFPGNMHNYIWCPYYLPSFMKFCSIVSEGLRWQAASVVNLGKSLSAQLLWSCLAEFHETW